MMKIEMGEGNMEIEVPAWLYFKLLLFNCCCHCWNVLAKFDNNLFCVWFLEDWKCCILICDIDVIWVKKMPLNKNKTYYGLNPKYKNDCVDFFDFVS